MTNLFAPPTCTQDPQPEHCPAVLHTGGVKNWRHPLLGPFRRLVAGAAILAVLIPGAALAQDAPNEDSSADADDEEAPPTPAPPPPPRAPRRAPSRHAAPAAALPERGSEAVAKGAPEKKEKEATAEDQALRGIVAIERGGQTICLGAVLAGDGRIVTALSPLGSGNDLDARFADGSTARVKLGHHDRAWDLALLVPQTGRWKDGLIASSRDPLQKDSAPRSFTISRGKVSSTAINLRGRRALLGADDASLDDAFEIGSRVSPLDLGAPIIDDDGRVVAVLGRGCAPNEGRPCTPVAFGAPIKAIKVFLRNVPASAVAPSPWLGIQGVAETASVVKGVRIMVVHPQSPAEQAQLKGGDASVSDVIAAVDGTPVTSPEALAEAIRNHAVGEKVPLVIFGQNKYRVVNVNLRAAPDRSAAPQAQPAHPAELPPAREGAGLPRRAPKR